MAIKIFFRALLDADFGLVGIPSKLPPKIVLRKWAHKLALHSPLFSCIFAVHRGLFLPTKTENTASLSAKIDFRR